MGSSAPWPVAWIKLQEMCFSGVVCNFVCNVILVLLCAFPMCYIIKTWSLLGGNV